MKVVGYALGALALFLAGCTANHGRYSLLSRKQVNLEMLTERNLASGIPSRGISVCKSFLLLPVERGCSMDRALSEALRNNDLLTEAQITYEKVDLFPIFERETWTVSGNSVQLAPK
ncbi:MAG: hypothetical protein ACK5GN_14080 [Pseudomonadota bacterium]|jgi:hypothetical protein